MSAFRAFEKDVVRVLVGDQLPKDQLAAMLESAEPAGYEFTGSGYFLEVRHPSLPQQRVVCSRPPVIGTSGEIRTGFVVFLENGELTLECHSWGGADVPEDFRDRDVDIAIVLTRRPG